MRPSRRTSTTTPGTPSATRAFTSFRSAGARLSSEAGAAAELAASRSAKTTLAASPRTISRPTLTCMLFSFARDSSRGCCPFTSTRPKVGAGEIARRVLGQKEPLPYHWLGAVVRPRRFRRAIKRRAQPLAEGALRGLANCPLGTRSAKAMTPARCARSCQIPRLGVSEVTTPCTSAWGRGLVVGYAGPTTRSRPPAHIDASARIRAGVGCGVPVTSWRDAVGPSTFLGSPICSLTRWVTNS